MEHGYGFPRIRVKPASPSATYGRQLDALREAFTRGDARKAIEASLNEAKITDLPRMPDGRHVVAEGDDARTESR